MNAVANMMAGALLGMGILGAIILIGLASAGDLDHPEYPRLQRCTEDVVLICIGDFHYGYYETYICGPAIDDYLGE